MWWIPSILWKALTLLFTLVPVSPKDLASSFKPESCQNVGSMQMFRLRCFDSKTSTHKSEEWKRGRMKTYLSEKRVGIRLPCPSTFPTLLSRHLWTAQTWRNVWLYVVNQRKPCSEEAWQAVITALSRGPQDRDALRNNPEKREGFRKLITAQVKKKPKERNEQKSKKKRKDVFCV